MNNAIILLSGGLDSVVSLAIEKEKYDNFLALTFNYGQKSFLAEKKASENIAKYYNIKHEVISLDWLSKISTSSLTTNSDIPQLNSEDLEKIELTKDTAKSVWVPNRNGLFVNIAACYAEALEYNTIIIGANKEEGETFKDNSIDFINAINHSFKNSLNKPVQLNAPLINMTKEDIVKKGISLNIPFDLIYSCYNSFEKHCGTCESCQRLKRALKLNNREDLINKIF